MWSKEILFALLAVTGAGTVAPPAPPLIAVASPVLTEEQRATQLVERLVTICSANPEVERAFVLVRNSPDGSPAYTFIPIFDGKVSDKALAEADAAYRELFPSNGYLGAMLLTRSTWKKHLGGAPPIYVRPGK